jgi:type I pantothenate kinase
MRYIQFTKEEWGRLRAATPLTLTEEDLAELHGINERISLEEVALVYLPLSRLLNLYVAATQNLRQTSDTFLGALPSPVSYVIAIAGSVAVGKSTTARVIQALLSRWPNHPKVDLVTTDGFLYPNSVLEARGIMGRKGFPESYDLKRLLQFLSDLKSGILARILRRRAEQVSGDSATPHRHYRRTQCSPDRTWRQRRAATHVCFGLLRFFHFRRCG